MQQIMSNSMLLLTAILVFYFCQTTFCAPYQDVSSHRSNEIPVKKSAKKDIFISRGWGAGGMPFSVLYMNPAFSSSKAPATVETNFRPQHQTSASATKNQSKSLPQVRTSMRQKSSGRRPHSVIPQLFVSYGWGPLGKK